MEIIDDNTVVVQTSDELKLVLEEDNNYNYIYFGSDITLSSKININENKKHIVIDGTYGGNRYTYKDLNNVDKTEVITANIKNEVIVVKNIDIVNVCKYGVVYVPQNNLYNVTTEYINVKFNGIEMIFNPYGNAKILDCNITLERTLGIENQEVCEVNHVIIGGNTTITSTSPNFSLFYWVSDAPAPSLTFMANSYVTLTAGRDLIEGINNLDFKILHDATVILNSKNGFAYYSHNGAGDVLIDKRATFNITETSHKCVPMWSIYGNFTMNENSILTMTNSYSEAPIDNYGIYFKGLNKNFVLNNPKKLIIYNKKASAIYTDNPINYSFKIGRINLWTDSYDLSIAGSINNLPDYSWYKEDDLEISGTFTTDTTTVLKHNLSDEDLSNLPDLNNFVFQNKKQLSIGNLRVNIGPISDTVRGYTLASTDVLIKYNNISQIVSSDNNGFFELALTEEVNSITIITNDDFLYKTRIITLPYDGEITIMEVDRLIKFDLTSSTNNLFFKTGSMNIKIIDSRNTNNYQLFAKIKDVMSSSNGFKLKDSIVFKTFDNEIINMTTDEKLVYDGVKSDSIINLTYQKDEGILLDLTISALEINEEYETEIIWTVK